MFEFKTKSLNAGSIINQLKAGARWCACLRKVVAAYAGESKTIVLKKFVLTENNNPNAYLDPTKKYLALDSSVRHYHYDDLEGLGLDDLDNTSIQKV